MTLYDKKYNKHYDNEEEFFEGVESKMGEKENSEALQKFAIDIFDCLEEWSAFLESN